VLQAVSRESPLPPKAEIDPSSPELDEQCNLSTLTDHADCFEASSASPPSAFQSRESTLRRKPLSLARSALYIPSQRTAGATFSREPTMTDHILSIALVFSILAGGTAAIGSELVGSQGRVPAQTTAAAARVTLPTIVVTGRRHTATLVAADRVADETQRVQ